MQKVVEKGMKGDVQAIKFWEEIAWREGARLNDFSSRSRCLTTPQFIFGVPMITFESNPGRERNIETGMKGT